MSTEKVYYKKLADFNLAQIREISVEYANTDNNTTRKYLAKKYMTRSSVITKIIYQAFSLKLISLETGIKIAKKAIKNSSKYGGKERTMLYYHKLLSFICTDFDMNTLEERKENISFTPEAEFLRNQINTYDDFAFEEEDCITKEELEKYLKTCK